MDWKYPVVATVATAVVGWLASTPQPRTASAAPARARSQSVREAASDIEEQAQRLRSRLRDETIFRTPGRDPFHFAAKPVPAAAAPAPAAGPVVPAAPAAPVPFRPPIRLTAIAADAVDGVTQRTAVLNTIVGMIVVREGDSVDPGYRVRAVGEQTVELDHADGSSLTLRLGATP